MFEFSFCTVPLPVKCVTISVFSEEEKGKGLTYRKDHKIDQHKVLRKTKKNGPKR